MPDGSHDLTRKRLRDDASDVQNVAQRPCKDSLRHVIPSEHPSKDYSQADYFIMDKLVDPALEEEIIQGVMKRLEEEMNGSQLDESYSSCDGSHELIQKEECLGDSSTCSVVESNWNSSSDACSRRVDIEYLMGASDDELGLPPSPHSLEGNDGIVVSLQLETEVEELLRQYTSNCWAEPSADFVLFDIKDIKGIEWPSKAQP